MKRVLLLFLILLSFNIVSALNIELNENFQPGETALGTIEANFLSPITPENIYFYSDRVSIPLVFDIARISDKYYFYIILPVHERNYTMMLKNAHYFENSKEILADIEKNFSVLGNITEFSVYPGFIITKQNFTLSLESKNQAQDITIQVQNQTKQVHIPIAQTKKVDLSVSSDNFTLTSISISGANTKYEIPLAILSSNSSIFSGNTSGTVNDSEKFRFSKSEVNLSLTQKTQTDYTIYLVNVGDKEINDIQLTLEGDLKTIAEISPSSISLKEAESRIITLSITAPETGIFTGQIIAKSDNLTALSELTINSFSQETPVPPLPNPSSTKETCITYGGIICGSGQACKGTVLDSLDGDCCLSECEKKTSYTSIIIGVLLLIGVGVGLFFLYKRQKEKSKPPSSREIVQKQTNDFEKRILGQEVRSSLARS
ncbi:MAG: hypothetical protein KKE50_05600 [Nanoarchaeota archaeon]|nr:hypothetical protein [Nanoarchaeota archaeon]